MTQRESASIIGTLGPAVRSRVSLPFTWLLRLKLLTTRTSSTLQPSLLLLLGRVIFELARVLVALGRGQLLLAIATAVRAAELGSVFTYGIYRTLFGNSEDQVISGNVKIVG